MTDKFELTESLELKINILSLSDEVIVHICGFLASTDLVSLSLTSRRINSILCERKLVRNVDLTAPYSLKPVDLRSFFLPRVRSKNIDTIALTSCYWLTSSDLLWIILRLTNLRSLHVHDTNLSVEHLARILKNIKSIMPSYPRSLGLRTLYLKNNLVAQYSELRAKNKADVLEQSYYGLLVH